MPKRKQQTAEEKQDQKRIKVETDEAIKRAVAGITVAQNHRFEGQDEGAWRSFLEDNGYVVIKSLATLERVDELVDYFYTDLASLGTGITRDDAGTFVNANFVGIFSVGIFKDPSSGIGCSRFMFECRRTAKELFQRLHRDQDVSSSFDGAGVFRNWRLDLKYKTTSLWPHVDQGRTKGFDFQCYQGILNLLPADRSTGGLVVAPGSHKNLEAVLDTNLPKKCNQNYNPLNMTHPYIAGLCSNMRLVVAGPGDLILWDSRTIHSNTHAMTRPTSTAPLIRIAPYVCFLPRNSNCSGTVKIRAHIVESGGLSNHWPNYPDIKAVHMAYPRSKGFKTLTSIAMSPEEIERDFPDLL